MPGADLHGCGCDSSVAHNVGFDYAFLAAEACKTGVVLPVDEVMCTVELAAHLDLGVDNLKLATLARYFGVPQGRPHDALDDATVLARILARARHGCSTWSKAAPNKPS